jgi:hypothetical protein
MLAIHRNDNLRKWIMKLLMYGVQGNDAHAYHQSMAAMAL